MASVNGGAASGVKYYAMVKPEKVRGQCGC